MEMDIKGGPLPLAPSGPQGKPLRGRCSRQRPCPPQASRSPSFERIGLKGKREAARKGDLPEIRSTEP